MTQFIDRYVTAIGVRDDYAGLPTSTERHHDP